MTSLDLESSAVVTQKVLTARDVEDFFYHQPLEGPDRYTMEFHIQRWAYLLQAVDRLVSQARQRRGSEGLRILDIGEGMQTELLRANYPDIPVDVLDLVDADRQRRTFDEYHHYDLNDLYFEERWPQIGPYDVIVMAEVIEHLHAGALVALKGMASLLRAGGYLFVQTPNAVALHKRLQMLAGRNPYMDLDLPRETPPHYREYTLTELVRAGDSAGLKTVESDRRNYFTRKTIVSELYNEIANRLPAPLRAGISISYQSV
jgi:2-polyprenyl-3-methyl-5-hydroxy-6-metoxy-1,4-benzoquinol methylase